MIRSFNRFEPLRLPPVVAGTRFSLVQKRIIRIFIGVLVCLFIFAGVIWGLSLSLGDHETLYAGKPLNDWRQQLDSRDAGASNQACEVLNTQIIPRLVHQMFHDTNDSKLRLSLVETLNDLPGVRISFTQADDRRQWAATRLGDFGPPAKAAVPSLVAALKGPDDGLHEPAILALGKIHSDPAVIIPLLVSYLTNDILNDEAATALGDYGRLAKEAIPKLLPLSKDRRHEDARVAAINALKKIDPEAAATAGVK